MASFSIPLRFVVILILVINAVPVCVFNLTLGSSSHGFVTEHPQGSVLHYHERQPGDSEKDGCDEHEPSVIALAASGAPPPQLSGNSGFLANLQQISGEVPIVAFQRATKPGARTAIASHASTISLRI